jgi:Protein of unknown function (DUF3014)
MNPKMTALGVVALAAIGIAAFLFLRPKNEAPIPAPVPPAETAPQKPADVPLPPAAASDATLRSGFQDVSPKVAAWLAQPDLLDRFAALVDDLARDVSPRGQLEFLAPKERFAAKGGQIDPKAYARYDAAADAIASVDAQKFVAGVKAVHPMLESAYHRIADPNRSFDAAARAALQRIIDAPVVEGPIKVVPHGANDLFADEKLETLGPVEKQLLRMGPRNTKLIQAKSRELLAAMH